VEVIMLKRLAVPFASLLLVSGIVFGLNASQQEAAPSPSVSQQDEAAQAAPESPREKSKDGASKSHDKASCPGKEKAGEETTGTTT
jgi:hypothetical protein